MELETQLLFGMALVSHALTNHREYDSCSGPCDYRIH